ncbi:MAG: hypothetical protein KDJ52_08820 [Anaerolineae bacterium]|nr:hypothetical protein [Anaerolineae bacterium]
MDISSSPQINYQSVGQISTLPNHGELQLVKGQFIEARIQRVADSLAWLNMGGKVFVARLEIPLQANQKIALEVTDVTSTQIKLRLAGYTNGNQSQTMSQIFPQNLENQLISWGLEADDINLVISKTLFSHNQTIDPTDVETVRALWRGLSPSLSLPSLEGAETTAYLFARQLPVNTEAVALAHVYLNRLPDIAPQLTELYTTLDQAYIQIKSHANPSLGQLAHLLENTLSQVASWILPTDASPMEIATRLANLIPAMSVSPEAELANHLSQIQKLSSGDGNEGKPSLTSLIETSSINASSSLPNFTSGPAPSMLPATNPLYQLATSINKTLEATNIDLLDIDQAETQSLHKLVRQLDSLSNTLGAFQLSHSAQSPNIAVESYYLFPIPLATPNGPRTAHLKVYRQPGRNMMDTNNLRLALLLDLPELGQMAINLTIHQAEHYLSGQILSKREQTHNLASTELDKLQEQLVALGYRVGGLTTGLLENDEYLANSNDAAQIDSILSTQINMEA